MDRFVKNTYEILSPLNELTARMRMTQHRFLTPDRKVQQSTFGEGADAVVVVVNAGDTAFTYTSRSSGTVELPPYGFIAESRTFVAFHALSYGGLSLRRAGHVHFAQPRQQAAIPLSPGAGVSCVWQRPDSAGKGQRVAVPREAIVGPGQRSTAQPRPASIALPTP